jgi:F-type H+-transporting ATPase subunit epsilon
MAKTFKIQVVTPERQCLNEEVHYVSLPGMVGEFGVLPDHAPILAVLKEGVMRVEKDREVRAYRIGGGYAEVNENSLIVLAETLVDVPK